MKKSNQYLVAGIVVEAVKSEGGGFYDVTIVSTGHKFRALAWAFEDVASKVKENACSVCGESNCELKDNLLHKSYG